MLSYGFGAPFVLGGPLGASDPGCGTAELYSVLVSTVQCSTVQYSIVQCSTVQYITWVSSARQNSLANSWLTVML